LTDEQREEICQAFTNRQDIAYFARLVPYEEIVAQDYNLSVSFYVDTTPPTLEIDIASLNAQIKQAVTERREREDELEAFIVSLDAKIAQTG